MVWQQWRAVQVEAAERAAHAVELDPAGRARLGTPDPARTPARAAHRPHRALGHAAGRGAPVDLPRRRQEQQRRGRRPRGLSSGSITDAQARFNLANRRCPRQGRSPISRRWAAVPTVGLSTDVARASPPGCAMRSRRLGQQRQRPLRPRTLAQLAWLGLDAATITASNPMRRCCPARAGERQHRGARGARRRELIRGLDLPPPNAWCGLRQRDPFKTLPAVETQIPGLGPLNASRCRWCQSYFEVRGRLRLDDRVLSSARWCFAAGWTCRCCSASRCRPSRACVPEGATQGRQQNDELSR